MMIFLMRYDRIVINMQKYIWPIVRTSKMSVFFVTNDLNHGYVMKYSDKRYQMKEINRTQD
jgi:hypothetical protein